MSDLSSIAAIVFIGLMCVVVLFQLALSMGAPWGSLAMGGRYPGKFPVSMRIAAIVQALLLSLLAVTVAVRAGLLLPAFFEAAETGVWVVVAILSISLVMNLVTPSRWERIIWAPVVTILVITALLVACS